MGVKWRIVSLFHKFGEKKNFLQIWREKKVKKKVTKKVDENLASKSKTKERL